MIPPTLPTKRAAARSGEGAPRADSVNASYEGLRLKARPPARTAGASVERAGHAQVHRAQFGPQGPLLDGENREQCSPIARTVRAERRTGHAKTGSVRTHHRPALPVRPSRIGTATPQAGCKRRVEKAGTPTAVCLTKTARTSTRGCATVAGHDGYLHRATKTADRARRPEREILFVRFWNIFSVHVIIIQTYICAQKLVRIEEACRHNTMS